jgi:predicted nucleotidyltransferase
MMMSMPNSRQNFSDDELRRKQAETGVDVYALLDLMERTPAERLRIAMTNVRNVERLRDGAADGADEMTSTPGAFDPLAILGVLHRRKVQFVVIGGVAGFLMGSDLPSANLDICFASDTENAGQLALALDDLNARAAGSPSGEVKVADVKVLARGEFLNVRTDQGVLHCLSNPDGTEGYAQLRDQAERMEIDGMDVYVASLGDLIRMKAASSRARDRLLLETLKAVQRRRRRT